MINNIKYKVHNHTNIFNQRMFTRLAEDIVPNIRTSH